MGYRRLLLPLTGTASGEAALATALIAARAWGAHVHCLHVRVDARDVAPLAGEGLSGAMIEEMMAATERESGERADRVKALFDRFTAGLRRRDAGRQPRHRRQDRGPDPVLRIHPRAGGGRGGAAVAPVRHGGGAAPRGRRGRLVQRRAARHPVRFRPPGADRPARRPRRYRRARLRGLERHGRERGRRRRRAALAAQGVGRAHPGIRRIPAARPEGRGHPGLSALARHPGRDHPLQAGRRAKWARGCWARRATSAPTC